MDIEEIDKQIAELHNQRIQLEQKEREAKYDEWAEQILKNGSLDLKLFLDDVRYDRKIDTLYLSILSSDVPYDSPTTEFDSNGLLFNYEWDEDDGRIYYFTIKKPNNESFTIKELIEIFPKFEKYIQNEIDRTKNKLQKLEKMLEK